jgi:drug/metabolite transporter (DMT)-like permease
LLLRASKALPLAPPLRPLLWLVAAAVVSQIGGKVVFQWALGVIGMALTVPLCLGGMIVSGAVAGWWMLGERVTTQNVVAMAVLIVAVAVLSLGAPKAQASLSLITGSQPAWVLAGVAAALFSGLTYALLGVAIRNAARSGGPATATLVTVGLIGVLLLTPISYARIGLAGMRATPEVEWGMMIGAGLANAGAFLALIQSLKMTSVVHVNAVNATQATMASIAGIVMFKEAFSWALALGVMLSRTRESSGDSRTNSQRPRDRPRNAEGRRISSASCMLSSTYRPRRRFRFCESTVT